jgi:hypothetical protein
MTKLHIADKLKLPVDTVTATIIVYGGKGMGKTVLGAVLCEELAAAGQRFAVIDPMGVFWGLRHSADGSGPGIEILILGGRHGDIPIEPTGGAVVADLVVDESVNVVIDIKCRADGKMWSRGDRIRFVADYCTRLYERQGERMRPLMQIIDEAGRFIPETIRANQPEISRCAGAASELVEEGRNVGVGVTLITQRSARMSKAVSELADAMFAFRTVGPRSVEAILDWFGEHVPKERWKELIDQLRKLPKGTALVVSPGWLEFEAPAAIRMRHTFDSSATPKAGKERRASGEGARPDLGKYIQRMAETIERVKGEDPRELKKQIAELKKELAAKGTPVAVQKPEVKWEALLAAEKKGYERGVKEARKAWGPLARAVDTACRMLQANVPAEMEWKEQPEPVARPAARPAEVPGWAPEPRSAPPAPRPPSPAPASGSTAKLGEGEKKILAAIAQYPAGATRQQLTVLTGYKRSTRDRYIQYLAAAGRIAVSGDRVLATEEGMAALGPDFEPLPTGNELRRHWLVTLPEGESKILKLILDAHPFSVARDAITEATGYQRSTRDRYIQYLQARQLVEAVGRGEVRASAELFEE